MTEDTLRRGIASPHIRRRSRCPSTKVLANGKSGSQWRRSGVEGRGRCPGEAGVQARRGYRTAKGVANGGGQGSKGEVGVQAKSVSGRGGCPGEVGVEGKWVTRRRR